MQETPNPITAHPRRRGLVPFAAAALLLLYAALAITASRQHSATYDEAAFVTAGYTYWAFNDYRLHPENGLVTQLWVGLPVWLSNPHWPTEQVEAAWRRADLWHVSMEFLYRAGNDADAILLAARSMTVLAGVLLGLMVFLWSRRLFGNAGGLISLTLYTLSPTMIAHGGLATGDVFTALLLLASTACLWGLLHRVDVGPLVGVLVCVSLLVLAKTSWMVLGPITLVLLAVKLVADARRRCAAGEPRLVRWGARRASLLAAGLGVLGVSVYFVVWAAFGFRYPATPQGGSTTFYRSFEMIFNAMPSLAEPVRFAMDRRLLPEAFIYGTSFTLAFSKVRAAFLCGNYSHDGWWWFFPFAFAVKTTLAEWVFLLAGAAAAIIRRHRAWQKLYALTPLLALAGVYGIVSVTSSLNIGHRHLLPMYPVLFILAGAAATWLSRGTALMRGVLAVALVAAAAEAAIIWPHHLSYFNAFAGGPSQGYRLLVDSSLDWGQDLPALKKWLDREGLTNQDEVPVYLAYFGTASPGYYGIDARVLPGVPGDGSAIDVDQVLQPGVYCISATLLQSVYTPTHGRWNVELEAKYQQLSGAFRDYQAVVADPARRGELERVNQDQFRRGLLVYLQLRLDRLCRYLKQREPDAWAGHSIAIYRVSEAELRAALEGPPVELFRDAQVKGAGP